MSAIDWTDVGLSVLKIGVVLLFMLNVAPIMNWVERRGSALIQDRLGPNRVGPFGLFQTIADALKFLFKEDVVPAQANKWLYTMAPAFGLLPAMTTIAVVPFGRAFRLPSRGARGVAELTYAGISLGALARHASPRTSPSAPPPRPSADPRWLRGARCGNDRRYELAGLKIKHFEA